MTFSTKVRISKKLLKTLPAAVAEQIRELQTQHLRMHSVRLSSLTRGRIVLQEDGRYFHARFDSNEQAYVVSAGIQMASAHNLSGATERYRHEIGAEIPLRPGDFVLEVYYAGCDGYQLTLHNVPEPALPAPVPAT